MRNAPQAIEFYRKAFGARELYRSLTPDGQRILHLEALIGDSRLYLCEEMPGPCGFLSPEALQGTPITLHLYVENVDRTYADAVAAGAEVIVPLADQFFGDRYGMLRDPFGHRWSVASRIEDLSPDEIKARAAKTLGAR